MTVKFHAIKYTTKFGVITEMKRAV